MTGARLGRWTATLLAVVIVASACSTGGGDDGGPGDCEIVETVVSSEKITLMTELAAEFNGSDDADVEGGCVFVSVRSVASGGAAQLLADGWPDEEVNGPPPVLWSPASAAWGALVNHERSLLGEPPMVGDATPFMLTPLVIAMPQVMAEALGWPDEQLGFSDVLELARSDEGWAAFGHPEWGPFKLGKTNPNFSTSGLSMAIAQYSAAAGSTGELTLEDLRRSDVRETTEAIESAVVHYGDTTLTFLNNWYRADQRGTGLAYASAVAVEEVSVVSYNQGNPDGVLDPGEEPTPPREPLVAIYPREGTLFSDNPIMVLDAEWVTERARAGAEAFGEFVQRPENQERVLEFGFRPGNPAVAVADPITPALGVDPNQPQALLRVPEPAVLAGLLEQWGEQRKRARVVLLMDVSGSMGDPVADGATKLDLAKEAAIRALDQFASDDDVGLRIFTTEVGELNQGWVDLVPVGPISSNEAELVSAIERLVPLNGTPLYTAVGDAYLDAVAEADDERINAVVVLSDGRNEDLNDDLDGLFAQLARDREGNPFPVRVFPIAYGADADLVTLRAIAEATDAAVYDSSNPATIDKVFAAVISNF